MKLITQVAVVISMLLLIVVGMLHGAALAGAVAGIAKDGTDAGSIVNNVLQRNFSDPLFVATTIFAILYLSILAFLAFRQNKDESPSIKSLRGQFF